MTKHHLPFTVKNMIISPFCTIVHTLTGIASQ